MENLYIKIAHKGEDYWTIECNGKEYEVSQEVGAFIRAVLYSLKKTLTTK